MLLYGGYSKPRLGSPGVPLDVYGSCLLCVYIDSWKADQYFLTLAISLICTSMHIHTHRCRCLQMHSWAQVITNTSYNNQYHELLRCCLFIYLFVGFGYVVLSSHCLVCSIIVFFFSLSPPACVNAD